jgi:hypothetical protein
LCRSGILGDIRLSYAQAIRLTNQRRNEMRKFVFTIVALVLAAGAHAQAGTAVKEAGKATAETAKQGKENVQAAASSEPEKSVHKVKAKVHKAKAKSHGHAASAAAKDAVN